MRMRLTRLLMCDTNRVIPYLLFNNRSTSFKSFPFDGSFWYSSTRSFSISNSSSDISSGDSKLSSMFVVFIGILTKIKFSANVLLKQLQNAATYHIWFSHLYQVTMRSFVSGWRREMPTGRGMRLAVQLRAKWFPFFGCFAHNPPFFHPNSQLSIHNLH